MKKFSSRFVIFLQTLRTFRSKKSIILIVVLLASMFFLNGVMPRLTGLGKETNMGPYQMYLGLLPILTYMVYVSIVSLICSASFNGNETPFCITRPITRNNYILAKLLAQFLLTTAFAVLMCVFWQIANAICFIEPNENINSLFDPSIGFTIAATIVPYLVLNIMIITFSALCQWLSNNDWLSNAIIVSGTFTVLVMIGLTVYAKSEGNMAWFCTVNSLVVPCAYGGVVSAISIVLMATTIAKKKVRI